MGQRYKMGLHRCNTNSTQPPYKDWHVDGKTSWRGDEEL